MPRADKLFTRQRQQWNIRALRPLYGKQNTPGYQGCFRIICRITVSRVLSSPTRVLIIYLGQTLPPGSSGFMRECRGNANNSLLAANRVYLHHMSPYGAVRSYRTRFTLTGRIDRQFRFCGTFPRVAPGRR